MWALDSGPLLTRPFFQAAVNVERLRHQPVITAIPETVGTLVEDMKLGLRLNVGVWAPQAGACLDVMSF